MRLGLALPASGPDTQREGTLRACRTAEETGYDSLWAGDRVLAPRPIPERRRRNAPGLRESHDPLVALTFAASHTTRVHLGTSTPSGLWQPLITLSR